MPARRDDHRRPRRVGVNGKSYPAVPARNTEEMVANTALTRPIRVVVRVTIGKRLQPIVHSSDGGNTPPHILLVAGWRRTMRGPATPRYDHQEARRRLCSVVCAVLLGLGSFSGSARGQWLPTPVTAHDALSDIQSHPHTSTYWFEAAIIGVATVGATTALITITFCTDADVGCDAGSALLFGAAGMLLGGTVGALVGGAFPAPHTRPLRGEPARSALIGGVTGAIWSFGVFDRFCLNGCRPEEVAFGLATTAIGALAGLLASL